MVSSCWPIHTTCSCRLPHLARSVPLSTRNGTGIILLFSILLAERLSEALGEYLTCVLRAPRIHRARFGVVHPALAQLPAQMSWVVGDAVTIFDECVDRSWRSRLAFFEDGTEFVELLIGEFRGPPAPEARRNPSTPTSFYACARQLLLARETPTRLASSSSTSPA